MGDNQSADASSSHLLSLRLLVVGEEYRVNDVLGVTTGHPNIGHIRVLRNTGFGEMTMLHSTSCNDSFGKVKSSTSLSSVLSFDSKLQLAKEASNKQVGFALEPPSYHATDGDGIHPLHRDTIQRRPNRFTCTSVQHYSSNTCHHCSCFGPDGHVLQPSSLAQYQLHLTHDVTPARTQPPHIPTPSTVTYLHLCNGIATVVLRCRCTSCIPMRHC